MRNKDAKFMRYYNSLAHPNDKKCGNCGRSRNQKPPAIEFFMPPKVRE